MVSKKEFEAWITEITEMYIEQVKETIPIELHKYFILADVLLSELVPGKHLRIEFELDISPFLVGNLTQWVKLDWNTGKFIFTEWEVAKYTHLVGWFASFEEALNYIELNSPPQVKQLNKEEQK